MRVRVIVHLGCFNFLSYYIFVLCIWRRVLVETEATAVTLPGWMAYQRRL